MASAKLWSLGEHEGQENGKKSRAVIGDAFRTSRIGSLRRKKNLPSHTLWIKGKIQRLTRTKTRVRARSTSVAQLEFRSCGA